MITVKTQLSNKQFHEVRHRLHQDYPALVGCQMIRSGGQFKIAGVRGATVPAAITPEAIEEIVADVREYVPNEIDGGVPLWAGKMNRHYARRSWR